MAADHLQFLKNKFTSDFEEAKVEEFTEFPLWLHFVEIFNVLERKRITSRTPIALKNPLYELKFALADCVMLAEKERDCITQNKERPLLLRGCPPLHYVKKQWFLFKTKRKLVRIQKELIQLMTDADDVRPSLSSSSTGLVRVYRPTDLPHINFSRIHGFNEHLQKMEALLLQDTSAATNNLRAIGIVGMGGSGKTTLAQMLFHSPRVRERFSPMLWIELPHQYDPQLIASSDLEWLPGPFSNSNIDSPVPGLFRYLDRKKYLIVLDIMYPTINDFDLNRELEPKSESYLDFLHKCFPRVDGAAIIFTRRTKEEESETMDKLGLKDELCWYQLEPMLDKYSCWSIILDSIGEEISRHPILPKIKDYMVKRCDGLPLAAKTLADIISTKFLKDPSAIKMFRLIFNKPVAPTSEILKELRTYEGVYYADIVSDCNNQVEAGGSCNPRKVVEDLTRFSQAEITLEIDDVEEIEPVNTTNRKFIFKLDLTDDRDKRKALKTVSSLSGIDSISLDMKDKKLTVIGTVDPVCVTSKLRKLWPTDIVSVGPAKEPEKKEEPKKEEGKKEEPKKEEPKKEEEAKKDEAKKEEEKKPEPVVEIMPYGYIPYYPPMNTHYYFHQSMEENPNACVIL